MIAAPLASFDPVAQHIFTMNRAGSALWIGLRLSWRHPTMNGMIGGMTKAKIAVTLPPALVTRAQDAVREGRAPSISAYVAAALEEKAKLDDLKSMLDEMLGETGGPLTDRERIAADAALGIAAERRRKHRRK